MMRLSSAFIYCQHSTTLRHYSIKLWFYRRIFMLLSNRWLNFSWLVGESTHRTLFILKFVSGFIWSLLLNFLFDEKFLPHLFYILFFLFILFFEFIVVSISISYTHYLILLFLCHFYLFERLVLTWFWFRFYLFLLFFLRLNRQFFCFF